jgi:hypothetical protein
MKDKMKTVAKKEVKGHEARMHSKKMAMGGRVMPAQANAGGASRGLDRASAMSGRDMSGMGRPVGMKKGGKIKEFVKDLNEKHGASQVKNMTGPERNIGPKMSRVSQSNASLYDRFNTMELDAVERGKNKEKAALKSRTRSAPKYKAGGKVKCMAKGGGIEKKGKTRGKMC